MIKANIMIKEGIMIKGCFIKNQETGWVIAVNRDKSGYRDKARHRDKTGPRIPRGVLKLSCLKFQL